MIIPDYRPRGARNELTDLQKSERQAWVGMVWAVVVFAVAPFIAALVFGLVSELIGLVTR